MLVASPHSPQFPLAHEFPLALLEANGLYVSELGSSCGWNLDLLVDGTWTFLWMELGFQFVFVWVQ